MYVQATLSLTDRKKVNILSQNIAKTAVIYIQNIGDSVSIKDFAIIYANTTLKRNIIIGEHAVIGKLPSRNALMKKKIEEKGQTILKDNVVIGSNVVIYNNVLIGENSLIGDNTSVFFNVTIGDNVLISRNVTINSNTSIGNYTRIMDNTHITGRAVIGDHVFISVGVMSANDNSFGKYGYGNHIQGPVIEDYVSIGAGAVLLPGVTLKRGCMVAAGSVVKNDVPEDIIVAGNPATFVRKIPKAIRRYSTSNSD